MEKVVLITGASRGLGQAAATRLAQRGATVYGTSRRNLPDTAEGVHMRQLDVTDPASVEACVGGIMEEAGRVDVLVNNAGMLHAGLAEEVTMEQAKAVFETNFWGQVRMTNAVLPAMRQRGAGRVVFMGSLAGLISAPGQGFYAATKHALEGYAETLHYEVAPFGVEVVIIEPGFFATSEAHGFATGEEALPAYDDIRPRLEQALNQSLEEGDDPAKVAALVERVVSTGSPKLRYRIGSDAKMLPVLHFLLPQPLYAIGLRSRFDL
jgi:NAD(P)-dependent dehydrogenase (short-subunit alcohol dehydrogenase family)